MILYSFSVITIPSMNTTADLLSQASLEELTGVLIWQPYAALISPVLLIHDLLLTLDDEVCLIFSSLPALPYRFVCSQVRLVWPGPLSLPKALYYINRYLSIVSTTFNAYR